jgi:hypothetical protein
LERISSTMASDDRCRWPRALSRTTRSPLLGCVAKRPSSEPVRRGERGDFRRVGHDLLDLADHPVRLFQRAARRAQVVDDEAALVHVRQEAAAHARVHEHREQDENPTPTRRRRGRAMAFSR